MQAEPRPKPDLALLSAGWERDAETDQYRQPGINNVWLSHDAARVLAFGASPPEAVETPPADVEPTVTGLLGEILESVKRIERALGPRYVS